MATSSDASTPTGAAEAALEYAGRMKQKARFYLLLPKSVAERRKTTS